MITSTSNELIVSLSKLQMKKHRESEAKFLVPTPKLIKEALNEGFLPVLLLKTQECEFCLNNEIRCEIVSENVLKKLCGDYFTQGCVAVFEIMKSSEIKDGNFIVLDRIQDPGNVGAILRSALGANFLNVYLIDSADIYDLKTLRASMGAVFHLNIVRINEEDIIKKLTIQNKKLISLDMKGENVFETSFDEGVGFVVGNEGRGVSQALKDFCSQSVSIPMNNKLESLNAAVSASIVMYQVFSKQV